MYCVSCTTFFLDVHEILCMIVYCCVFLRIVVCLWCMIGQTCVGMSYYCVQNLYYDGLSCGIMMCIDVRGMHSVLHCLAWSLFWSPFCDESLLSRMFPSDDNQNMAIAGGCRGRRGGRCTASSIRGHHPTHSHRNIEGRLALVWFLNHTHMGGWWHWVYMGLPHSLERNIARVPLKAIKMTQLVQLVTWLSKSVYVIMLQQNTICFINVWIDENIHTYTYIHKYTNK